MCLITALHPSLNPRLVKEADALSGAGYDVCVIAPRFSDWGEQADAEFATRPWRVVERPAFGPRSPRTTRLLEIARRLLASAAVRGLGVTSPWIVGAACHPVVPALVSAAKRHPADLYIGHLVAGLPAAAIAAAHYGTRYAFDAEDFHPGDYADEGRFELERRLIRLIEERYLPGAAYVSAAAPMIAQAYRDAYGIDLPATIHNVFPLAHAPSEATPRGVTAPGPSVYWISQTIGPRRGLECAVRAIAIAKAKPHLYLRGNPAPGFVEELQRIAGEAGSSGRVHVLPRAVPSEMERIAATYDIGLAGEVGDTLNRRLALTNKQFTYLLAGVPVVMSDTPAHKAFSLGIEACVRIFRTDDPRSLARAMDELLNSPETLAEARMQAFELGQTRFNWEAEQHVLLDAVARALNENIGPKRAGGWSGEAR